MLSYPVEGCQRVLAGSINPVLRVTLADQDGEPVAAVGVVTATIDRASGTSVAIGRVTAAGAGTGVHTVALTTAEALALDVLRVTWLVGGVTRATSWHRTVGGFLFSIAEFRDQVPSAASLALDQSADLLRVRDHVQAQFESLCMVAFAPRYDFVSLPRTWGSSARMVLPFPLVSSVRSIRQWSSSTAFTDVAALDLAAVRPSDSGVVDLAYGVYGYHGVEVGFEHGFTQAPNDLKEAALVYGRLVSNRQRSGIPDRAISQTTPDGMTVNFGRIGTPWRPTGVDAVDEVLNRYDFRAPCIGGG